jgi:hypothetical protein
MLISPAKHGIKALGMVGKIRAGGGGGIARCAQTRCGDDGNIAGIYQRRMVGQGVSTAPRRARGRIAISRGAFYKYSTEAIGGRIAWRAVFAAGKVQYDLLTDAQLLVLSKQARSLCMTRYNLFMSRWLQSHRS